MSYKELFGINQVYKIIWIFSQSLFLFFLKLPLIVKALFAAFSVFSLQLQSSKPRKQRDTSTWIQGLFHISSLKAEEAWYCLPPHHSFWLKLIAPSTHSDTDVLLGAGYCLAQRNQCSPIHKSNPRLVKHRFVMLLHNRVSGLDGDTMRENDHS